MSPPLHQVSLQIQFGVNMVGACAGDQSHQSQSIAASIKNAFILSIASSQSCGYVLFLLFLVLNQALVKFTS